MTNAGSVRWKFVYCSSGRDDFRRWYRRNGFHLLHRNALCHCPRILEPFTIMACTTPKERVSTLQYLSRSISFTRSSTIVNRHFFRRKRNTDSFYLQSLTNDNEIRKNSRRIDGAGVVTDNDTRRLDNDTVTNDRETSDRRWRCHKAKANKSTPHFR